MPGFLDGVCCTFCLTSPIMINSFWLLLFMLRSKARTVNFGNKAVFEREFWTNTPGALALVWDFENKKKAIAAKKAAAEKAAAERSALP